MSRSRILILTGIGANDVDGTSLQEGLQLIGGVARVSTQYQSGSTGHVRCRRRSPSKRRKPITHCRDVIISRDVGLDLTAGCGPSRTVDGAFGAVRFQVERVDIDSRNGDSIERVTQVGDTAGVQEVLEAVTVYVQFWYKYLKVDGLVASHVLDPEPIGRIKRTGGRDGGCNPLCRPLAIAAILDICATGDSHPLSAIPAYQMQVIVLVNRVIPITPTHENVDVCKQQSKRARVIKNKAIDISPICEFMEIITVDIVVSPAPMDFTVVAGSSDPQDTGGASLGD
jgi:hypothetical protein